MLLFLVKLDMTHFFRPTRLACSSAGGTRHVTPNSLVRSICRWTAKISQIGFYRILRQMASPASLYILRLLLSFPLPLPASRQNPDKQIYTRLQLLVPEPSSLPLRSPVCSLSRREQGGGRWRVRHGHGGDGRPPPPPSSLASSRPAPQPPAPSVRRWRRTTAHPGRGAVPHVPTDGGRHQPRRHMTAPHRWAPPCLPPGATSSLWSAAPAVL
jgi:hypothetical protein